MNVFNNYKLIHQLPSNHTGLEASLLLENNSREYLLKVKLNHDHAPTKTVLFTQLITLHNYYQSLITPPIVAALQLKFSDDHTSIEQKRSTPGMGKINGRSRIKIQAPEEAKILGQLFLQLYPRNTYADFSSLCNKEMSLSMKHLFRYKLPS